MNLIREAEYNGYPAKCAASTEETCFVVMCDTANCSPDELPVTRGNWGQIFVWKVLVITEEIAEGPEKRSKKFNLLTLF